MFNFLHASLKGILLANRSWYIEYLCIKKRNSFVIKIWIFIDCYARVVSSLKNFTSMIQDFIALKKFSSIARSLKCFTLPSDFFVWKIFRHKPNLKRDTFHNFSHLHLAKSPERFTYHYFPRTAFFSWRKSQR